VSTDTRPTGPRDETPAIELRGARKHFGAIRAVDGVDLRIGRGEIFGLIGHNGAGKSTLFRMMLGLERPTAGDVIVDGTSVRERAFRDARRRIGWLPENVVLYDNLSALETMRFFARLKRAPLSQCGTLLERVGLSHAAARPVREFSKGMRQRLGFAQALLGAPRVLFLDEPTNGLDPDAIRHFYATLRTLRDAGTTVVITSHILAELQERVDRLAILSEGRLRAEGTVAQLRERTSMPLVFELTVAGGDVADVRRAAASVEGVDVSVAAAGLRLACPSSLRMAVLAALAPLGARVSDLRMREPSLEDVFFGFSE
jgi:Cu-processing system ATP-binding protein